MTDLEIRSSGCYLQNDWGVIHVTRGVDTPITQQIQLLHSKNREGRHKHPQRCWEMDRRERTVCPKQEWNTFPYKKAIGIHLRYLFSNNIYWRTWKASVFTPNLSSGRQEFLNVWQMMIYFITASYSAWSKKKFFFFWRRKKTSRVNIWGERLKLQMPSCLIMWVRGAAQNPPPAAICPKWSTAAFSVKALSLIQTN